MQLEKQQLLEQIKRLELERRQEKMRAIEKFECENECHICLELLHAPVTLNCQHDYCASCISEWLQKNDK
jgi:zinc finger of C3HC4-type, RING